MPSKKNNSSKKLSTSAEDAPGDLEKRYLKAKNRDLAKKLAESQVTIQTVTKERNVLQRKFIEERTENTTLKNILVRVKAASHLGMSHIVSISNIFTDIITQITPVTCNQNVPANPEKSPHKTQTVKPMVSGLTISKPTIKLQRLSDNLRAVSENTEPETARGGSESPVRQNGKAASIVSETEVLPSTSAAAGPIITKNVTRRLHDRLQELEMVTEMSDAELSTSDENVSADVKRSTIDQLSTIVEESSLEKTLRTRSVSFIDRLKRTR